MALVVKDRVKETTTTTSTGSVTLSGAATGFQTFNSAIGVSNTTYYCIAGQGTSEWEVGLGTLSASTTLARTTVLASSNAGSLVNFSAGTKDVFVTYPAGKSVYEDANDNVVIPGIFQDTYGSVRSVPQNSQTTAYVLVATDNGKHISITTGGVTVPASVFSTGDVVTIFNNSGSNQTITQGASVTLRLSGTATTGNRTLSQYGVCTVLCIASNTFVISGAGLS